MPAKEADAGMRTEDIDATVNQPGSSSDVESRLETDDESREMEVAAELRVSDEPNHLLLDDKMKVEGSSEWTGSGS